MGLFKKRTSVITAPVSYNFSYERESYVTKCAEKLNETPGIDSLFVTAGRAIMQKGTGSYGVIQRYCKVGFNRASRIMDQLAYIGIVGMEPGTTPKSLLVTPTEFEKIIAKWKSMNHPNLTSTNKTNFDFDNMTGQQFESFCSFVLISNGFKHVEITKGSGDHGIDILADKDEISYAIQCKCYSSNVGNDAVQQALAGKKFYKRDIAVVLTNQYFTPQAKEEASVFGVKLWDRTKLNEFVQNINN